MTKKIDPPLQKVSSKDLDFNKMNGLIPVIVQDFNSGTVLMLAFTNSKALKKTETTGYAHYWSRSRNVIWKKGEISGNLQQIVEILVDCDKDTLIFKVKQNGPACHTGEPNCFFKKLLMGKDK